MGVILSIIIYIAFEIVNLSFHILQMTGANPNIGFWDIIDFAVAAYLIYLLYKLLKGTVAFNIFIGVMLLYVLWWTVRAMNMNILSTILDQFVSVGVIVLVIIFQPEIRRFLLMVGSTTFKSRLEQIEKFFKRGLKFEEEAPEWLNTLRSCIENIRERGLSAVLVVTDNLNHESFISSGIRLNAPLSKELCVSLALNNSPVHEGAMIIHDGRLISAGCSLPVASKQKTRYSLRERSAVGISEQSNALVILLYGGEKIHYAAHGELHESKSVEDLMSVVERHLTSTFAL